MERLRLQHDSGWRFTLDAILNSYGLVYFSDRRWFGGVLLIATMLAPFHGLVGLSGTLVTIVFALQFGFDRAAVRSGRYSFNSLLVALALAEAFRYVDLGWPSWVLLLVMFSALTLLVTVGLETAMMGRLGLPSMSLPFVVVHLLLFLLFHTPPSSLAGEASVFMLVPEVSGVSGYLNLFLQSLGAIVFMPYVSVGLLILIGMLCHSRLTTLFAGVGFVTGMAVLGVVPEAISRGEITQISFNFVFCGIALGGVFFIPSRGSMVLAIIGAAICAMVAVVELNLFRAFGYPPVALPFNLVVLLVVYVLKGREFSNGIEMPRFVPMSPERNFRKFHLDELRFPDLTQPTLLCPFAGSRTITQGFGGAITHREQWKHALDFEVVEGENQKQSGGGRLEDYFTFNTPVYAPGDGIIVKAIGGIDDCDIGMCDYENNWGNLAIVHLDTGGYAKLCHLRQGSLVVEEGQRVRAGQMIGYCGNSGRSPVPHLHVQMQQTPEVGAPTVPFRLRHYLQRNGKGTIYITAGVPQINACVEGTTFDDRVARCFTNIQRGEYCYQVRQSGRVFEETVSCDINEYGNYVFESSRGSILSAVVVDNAFYVTEFQGNTESMLHWARLGLGRVPFIDHFDTRWHESVDVWSMLRPAARCILDVAAPFWRMPTIQAVMSLKRLKENVKVSSAFDPHMPSWLTADRMPQQIDISVCPNDWISGGVVKLKSGVVLIERID